MNINTDLVSVTEANQNFSKDDRNEQTAKDEDVRAISQRLIKKNREAYKVLAK